MAQNISQNFSIKDSFADLDLGPLNFKRLFDAPWLCFSNHPEKLPQSNLSWRAVKDGKELEGWERSWDEREGNVSRIFTNFLLIDPTIRHWFGYSIDGTKAGYISNVTGNVIGISNILGSNTECIRHTKVQFPRYKIVGYETGYSLKEAKGLGAEVIGDLTIWI
ncbi:MAG: hypothetical protein JKY12_02680 [Sneathiella sp.]|nr:hypothetical protein [Sneathiella sp.]